MNERERLIDGARALGVTLGAAQADALLRLLDELSRWNRAYNLTAITGRGRMLTHHLLDSLSVHPHLHGSTVADVGTGAGFPGLPLAVTSPEREFTLIDSGGKKMRFVAHAARVLELANVHPLHARVESLHPQPPFDTVVARAFAPVPELLESVAGLCGPGTRVLAMKGDPTDEEVAGAGPGWRLAAREPLSVPGLAEARSLVAFERL
jgi:16S rRNA (guanine527-N7)-methyltransferase